MTWLLQENTKHPSRNLRHKLGKEGVIMAPGVFNPLVALIAEKVGFRSAYVSGASFSASMGLPDVGIFTLSDLSTLVRSIARASNISLIVDIDTGFGEALNVMRAVKELEDAGAAAVQMEDQVMPKKCGHLEGKELVPVEAMVEKIKAAKRASSDMILVARTDAKSVLGLEEVIRRARLYIQAGADVIFPEALTTKDEFRQVSAQISVPLLANMTEFGKTPYISADEFYKLGYKIVIYPVTSLRVAMKAVESTLQEILNEGTQKKLVNKMQTRSELYELIKYESYESLNQSFTEELKKIK